MNQKGFAPILIVLGVLITATLILGIFLITKPKTSSLTTSGNAGTKTQLATPAATNDQKPSASPLSEGYKKKQFKTDDKFADQEGYPAELINYNENDLVGMKCTPKYSDSVYGPGDLEFYLDGKYGTEPQDVISDEQKKELISKVNVDSAHLSDAQFCRTEDNRVIWSYGTDYLSPKQITYFELSTSGNESTNITKISGSKYGWFSCGKPLMLTKSGMLYYQCQGGSTNVSNPMVEQTIYSIDLNNKSYKQYSLKQGSSI